MEEEYLSDIFEDAFESFEDELSLGVLAGIQQPRSSLQITTAVTGRFRHYSGDEYHEQWPLDCVIDIGDGGGGGGAEREEEEDGGEEEEGGGGGGNGGEGGGEEEEEEEEEEGDGGGEIEEEEEEEGGGGGEIEEEEEEEGDGGGEIEEKEEEEEGEGEGDGGGEIEEEEEGEGGGGGEIEEGGGVVEEEEGLGGGGREEGGGGNEGHGYNNIGGGHHLLISKTKCIFKVPKYIREVDERAYTPQWVSIGPYHYGNRKLSFMESQKKKLLASRRWDPDRRSSLRTAMLEFEARARRCYSTKFNNINSHTFGEMMLTDAFFIIHLFLFYDIWCKNPDDRELHDHPIFTTRWRLPNICQDLLLLENQLPFFILAQVFAILTNRSANSLKKLAIQFFKQVHFGKVTVTADDSRFQPPENPKHLLDLFHSSFEVDRGNLQQKRNTLSSLRMETNYWVNNTSALSSDGVKFIGTEGNPLDIEFNWLGHLTIPTFCINHKTMSVLKNLLAYEQGLHQVKPYFTCLAVFFSNIAAGPDDIKILREAGIIQHQPADDEKVVVLLQQLYKAAEYSFNDCLIKHQVQHIDKFVTSRRGWLIGTLRREAVANLIRFLVLFVTLFFSLSLDTFRIRI